MEDSLIGDLIDLFRTIAVIGLIITGALLISLDYKGHKKFFQEKYKEYKWVFYISAGLITILLIFIYNLLF